MELKIFLNNYFFQVPQEQKIELKSNKTETPGSIEIRGGGDSLQDLRHHIIK